MFNNELMADVHFIVGPPGETQKVPAHKVNLTRPVGLHLYFHKAADVLS